MVRKIAEKVPDEQLQKDLEKYRQRALELGATDAKIITADMIVVDERVRAKCIYPVCFRYGTSLNCPPYVMDVEQTRKIVNNFRHAIFTRLEVSSEKIAGPEAAKKRPYLFNNIETHKIVSKIEAEAFSDGYYLAMGFASGSCKGNFCPNVDCSALTTGQPCRHSLRARPSMEGVGMDVYKLATKVGWDIYPIGASTSPSEVPCGTISGLVLIY